jgi:flagellar biosynthesis protein FlhF
MRNEIGTLRGMLEQQLSSLAWGNTERQSPVRAKLIRQLLELDLSTAVASKIADSIDEDIDYRNAWQEALTYITDNIPVNDEDMVVSGGVVALVGPTGVGKTTTIAKLASRYALRYGRSNVGLVTIDNYRVGAHEQLKTYAKIFDIPMRVATTREALSDCVKSLSDRSLILIDTAGMSHKDIRLANQFKILEDCVPNLKTLLVMSATTHRLGLDEIVRSFGNIKIDGCVMTKLDETTNLGGTLSVLLKHNLPITYYCDGQKMPEALHIATAHSLVNRSVLIARKVNQPLGNEAVELAFTGKKPNAYV